MKKFNLKDSYFTLKITSPDGKEYPVLQSNCVSDEIIFFTKDGIFISTRRGCAKLDSETNK